MGNLSLTVREVHPTAQPWCKVGGDRNAAMTALREKAQSRGIVSRQKSEIGANETPQPWRTRQVTSCVLQADDVRNFSKTRHRVVDKRTGGSRRHVVEKNRQSRRFSDSAKVSIQAVLARLVVVGHYRKDSVGAARF